VAKIENEMQIARQKTIADGEFFSDSKELETIKQQLSEQFLKLKAIQAISNNAEYYIGKKIPNYF